jgi:hypothetical protein
VWVGVRLCGSMLVPCTYTSMLYLSSGAMFVPCIYPKPYTLNPQVDRRKRPPGGGILSDWGAEDEI